MVTKPTPSDRSAPPAADEPGGPNTSASNVWLAGLGALASAQAEGSRAFEALVKQGMEIQNKTQALAKERVAEAAQRMGALTGQTGAGTAPWNKLGGIFEDRVAQALTSMGMPTAQELAALTARVEALEQALAARQGAAAAPAPAKKRAPPKPRA